MSKITEIKSDEIIFDDGTPLTEIGFWEVMDGTYETQGFYLTIEDVLHDYPTMKKETEDEYIDLECKYGIMTAWKIYPQHFRN